MIHQNSVRRLLLATLLLLPATAQAANPKNEIQNTYFLETYSADIKHTRGTELVYIYRGFNRLALLADVIYQKKYERNESLQKLGGTYQVTDRLAIQEFIGFSSDKWTFPKFFSDTELDIGLISRLSLLLGYKVSAFAGADVSVYAIGANYFPNTRLYFHAKLLHAISRFTGAASDSTFSNNSYVFKAGFFPDIKDELVFLYATNSESYLSIDQVGKLKADTYGFNWKNNIKGNWWLNAGFHYQKRREPLRLSQRYMEIGWIYSW